jgi:outer membrane receptor protein involved in Fe transport
MANSRIPGTVKFLSTVFVVFLACSITSISASAQTATGGIRGVITDSSGAALPGASVTAINVATGVDIKTTTTGDGLYTVPRILPGKYTVRVEVRNFKRSEVTDVEVNAGRDSVIDVQLEPGQISEVVTVNGAAEALIEKDTVQISSTFQQRKIAELPVSAPGTGLDRIALLVPGVTVGFGNVNGNGVTLSANGQRARSNNFTIDGVDNNDLSIGGPNYFVRNPLVVGEYQVVTNNFSAEYGRNQGAIVNIVSRSGSNEYHGAGTWAHLDRHNFDSLTNIERRTGTQTDPAPNLSNIFTYGVGGPIIKNRLFFYTTGYFLRNPGLADLRTSNFAPTPAGIQALNAAFPNNPAVQYYANYSAFALPLGNPQVRTDVAQSTITIGNVTVPVAAVQRLVLTPINQDEYTVRADGNIGDRHRLWGRYFWQNAPGINALRGVDGFSGDQPSQSKQIGGGWNFSISPRINNEFRFNYSRLFVIFGGGDAAGKGQIPHPDEIDRALTNFNPNFTAANGTTLLPVGPATNLPQGRTVESFQYTDNVSLTYGNHQMKAGFDYRQLQNIAPFLPNVNGAYVFASGAEIAANTPTQTTVAFGPATLSYGELDQFYYFQDDWRIRPNLTLNLGIRYENTGQPINLLNQVTREREQVPSSAFWRFSLPLEERINPRIATDNNNWAPRFGFAWSPGFGEGVMGTIFGRDKTVIRGGIGMAYDATFYNLMLNISTAAPTVFLTSAQFGVPNAVPTGDKVREAAVASGLIAFNVFDPKYFTRTTINPIMRSPYSEQWSFGIQREFAGNNVLEVRYVGTHGVGLFQTVNLNPFIGNLYNGFSRTYFDPVANANATLSFPAFPGVIPSGIRPLTCTNDPATRDDESACNGRIFPYGQARERINGAQSIYHSLQMRFDGQLRKDVTYGLTYTFSKSLDNSSEVFSFNGGNSVAVSQNPLDLTRDERGYSGFDVPHSFTANFLWELPFMREQKGILGRIIGGWQLNGIFRLQNGIRWTPTHPLASRNPYEDGSYMANFFGSGSHFRPFKGNAAAPVGSVAITDVDACLFYARCGTTGGQPTLRRSPTGFYLMSALNNNTFTPVTRNDVQFVVNGPGAARLFGTPFGGVTRNSYQGDRIEVVDFSVFKTFRITETVRFQYRLEMFNALNHPVFGIPNSINVDNRNFFNFQEQSGGRRQISMSLGIQF